MIIWKIPKVRRRYRRGDRVRHVTLGDGTFITYADDVCGPVARINFDGAMGIKEIVLAFCGGRLRKIKRATPPKRKGGRSRKNASRK